MNPLAHPEIANSRTKKRRQHVEMVKDEITRAAAKLFVKQGYSQTTMAEIARAVGMSKANLYNYVQSKDEFTFLILDKISQGHKKFMDAVNSSPPDTTAVKRLSEAIRGYAMVVNEYQDEFIFIQHAVIRLDRSDRQILYDSAVRLFHFFTEIIRMGITQGEIQVHNPELLSRNIVNAISNWALDRWYWRRTIPLEDYIEQQTELALRQLVPTKN